MTRYTVVWDPELDHSFNNAWIASDSRMRRTLTAIANWLDAELAENPEKKGQSRSSRCDSHRSKYRCLYHLYTSRRRTTYFLTTGSFG